MSITHTYYTDCKTLVTFSEGDSSARSMWHPQLKELDSRVADRLLVAESIRLTQRLGHTLGRPPTASVGRPRMPPLPHWRAALVAAAVCLTFSSSAASATEAFTYEVGSRVLVLADKLELGDAWLVRHLQSHGVPFDVRCSTNTSLEMGDWVGYV